MAPLSSIVASIPPSRLLVDVGPWLGGFVVLLLVGGAIAMGLRRRLNADSETPSLGFTLEDLRSMRDRGELSQEEFEQAHQRMVGQVRRAAAGRGATESRALARAGVVRRARSLHATRGYVGHHTLPVR